MSNGQKFYCMCGNNCKYETMTKEQILAAIVQAIETGTIMDVDTGFVTRLKEQNSGTYISFWIGTKEQYNRLTNKDKNCLYIISDDTTTEDLRKMIEDLQKDVKEATTRAAQSAPWGLVTMKNVRISSMEDLENTIDEAAAYGMELFSTKVISCRLDMDEFNCGAQITIHKGADSDGVASVRVHFQTDDGIAMQRYAWSDGAENQLNWEAWEYINPPMEDGVEYRTAERHNGKPVYVWTRSVEMGDSGITLPLLITSDATENLQIISLDAVIKPPANYYPWTTFPAFNEHDESLAATCDIHVEQSEKGDCIVFAMVKSLVTMTGHIATVTVKYTK